MTIHGRFAPALADLVAALLEGDTAGPRRRILLVPTASETFAALRKTPREFVVVTEHPGVRAGAGSRIVKPFDAVRQPPCERADIVCFPDQYASPALSPLFGAETGMHVSAVELVLAHATSAGVNGWWNSASSPAHETADVIALLEDYFRHCESLGERWLLRDAQGMRNPGERRRRLRHKVNHMASSVLYNSVSGGHADIAAKCWQRLQLMSARVSS